MYLSLSSRCADVRLGAKRMRPKAGDRLVGFDSAGNRTEWVVVGRRPLLGGGPLEKALLEESERRPERYARLQAAAYEARLEQCACGVCSAYFLASPDGGLSSALCVFDAYVPPSRS